MSMHSPPLLPYDTVLCFRICSHNGFKGREGHMHVLTGVTGDFPHYQRTDQCGVLTGSRVCCHARDEVFNFSETQTPSAPDLLSSYS